MVAQSAVALRKVTIDSTNKAIYFRYDGTYFTATLTEGDFFLRGDGTSDDLFENFKDAMQGAPLGPTGGSFTMSYYADNTHTMVSGNDPASILVTVLPEGGDNQEILWDHANTTADHVGLALGFTTDTPYDNYLENDAFPTGAAVVNYAPINLTRARTQFDVNHSILRSRKSIFFRRSDPIDRRDLTFELQNEAFTDAWDSFVETVSDGDKLELHLVDYFEPPNANFPGKLDPLSASTKQGTFWTLDVQALNEWQTTRHSPGVARWAGRLPFIEWVA